MKWYKSLAKKAEHPLRNAGGIPCEPPFLQASKVIYLVEYFFVEFIADQNNVSLEK